MSVPVPIPWASFHADQSRVSQTRADGVLTRVAKKARRRRPFDALLCEAAHNERVGFFILTRRLEPVLVILLFFFLTRRRSSNNSCLVRPFAFETRFASEKSRLRVVQNIKVRL